MRFLEFTTQYQVVCDGTKKGIFADKNKAIANAKSMFKHEKEYYHIAVVDLNTGDEVWSWSKKDVAEDLSRRGFLKGLGAAAMAGATSQAFAQSNSNNQQPAKPSNNYAGMVYSSIKPNILFPESEIRLIEGNPETLIEIQQSSDGTITDIKIVRSSGYTSWDNAVIKALTRTKRLPQDVDGRVFSPLQIAFRPKNPTARESANDNVIEHIVKHGSGYRLVSKKSGKNLGDFPSKAAAQKHEREVEYFKHLKENISETDVAFEINSEDAYNAVLDKFGGVIEWSGDYMVAPRKYWGAIQATAYDNGGDAIEAGNEQLDEFAPGGDEGGNNDPEDVLLRFAKMWYSAPDVATQRRVEQALAKIGWEIGELESDAGGAFVMRIGDEAGDSYLAWSEEQLAQLNELTFKGSQCTKDCSGHRAGYEWSQRKGGVDAASWSPSFNKGAWLFKNGH